MRSTRTARTSRRAARTCRNRSSSKSAKAIEGENMRSSRYATLSPQRGAVAVIVVISLAVLIIMAGLVRDVGHAFVNKTRLQNTVDAAALAAAKVLDDTCNTTLATIEAMQAFGNN